MSFGTIITDRLALPARGATTVTDTTFLACKTASGPSDHATLCRSLLDFQAAYGARAGMTVAAYDWADAYFRFGGKRLYVGRYGANYTDAFALFDSKYGPGQLVVEPTGTTPSPTVYSDMRTHCAFTNGASMNNRVAVRDVPQGTNVSQLETFGDDASANDDLGATFGPWVQIPAPAGVYGAGPRLVPASAAVCGTIARADQDGNPNRAAAGPDYFLSYATGLEYEVTDVDRAGLFAHGVNSFILDENVYQIYGFQTNVAENPDNPYWQFNCSRARMWLKARAQTRGKRYMFRPIDGRGLLAGALKSDLQEECGRLFAANGLFGATPAEAYYVDVDEAVNTVDEIALGHLHAVAQVRLSLHTKAVLIDLVTVPVTSTVG